MAGYRNILENMKNGPFLMKLGRTSCLYREGKTPEEISTIIKCPIEDVYRYIEIVKMANENRKKMEKTKID